MAEILITGIELSKEGYTEIRLYEDGSVLYKAKDNIYQNYADIQFKDAKAQELPPHGDLISRDEVKKSLSALFRAYLPDKQETKAYKIINEAPIIIEASTEGEAST